jgi:hypothetical protein
MMTLNLIAKIIHKSNFKIDNRDIIDVDLKKFNTNCIDIVTI